MDAQPGASADAQLRQQYDALLAGDSITADYERWRELKRLVIVHGLPRDEGFVTDVEGSNVSLCSLRGRVWKAFLGVENDVDMTKYAALVGRGASHYDGDIRNDTFRTFRGDLEFAQRVPEEKLVRLLNVFINELGSNPGEEKQDDGETARNGNLPSIRYVQGMNVLCAPLLYVLPEADAYHTFCQLLVRHCPHYMAPQLKGVEKGCALVDKCLETLDPDLYQHLSSRGITARIYALPLILSLFACVPPLHELLRVWDVLFAVGVHFVVVLAVAHTVLLREQLLKLDMDLMKVLSLRCAPALQSDLLISVALQLLHRLPGDLLYEIARHPFENPDAPTSLPFHPKTISAIATQVQKQQQPQQTSDSVRTPRSSTSSRAQSTKDKPASKPSTPRQSSCSRAENARPPWKI
ncbi:Rab-GTPase-TBC domain [Phytophthora infestans]|uniref:Rab-GTPase-TBC domain n=1 Tax=Phytophthora infestans TaxID=4787 RepID=A0A833SYK5_PHYIN|nr:Rab-GTPase-TBC domain [Phytophthora infestans]KAF4149281.1 Rab-GTPase-TBC domain [Phytophthora infestans]